MSSRKNLANALKGKTDGTSAGYRMPFFFSLPLLAMFLVITSCAAHSGLDTRDSNKIGFSVKDNGYSDYHEIEKHIREEYMRWKGTQHRLGGTDHGGIDCSGFVREVYKNVFNIELPRTTEGQVKEGRSVKQSELQSGDLVFFKPPDYPRHVGIFLSENEFVHASKSKGIIISQIDPYYWGKYYWTGRRVLSK